MIDFIWINSGKLIFDTCSCSFIEIFDVSDIYKYMMTGWKFCSQRNKSCETLLNLIFIIKWASLKVKMSKEDNIDKYKTLVSNLENELKSKGKKAWN